MSDTEEKEEVGNRYDHSDLPKVKNVFFYIYGCIMKWFFWIYIGGGALWLAIFIFPWIRLFVRDKAKFQKTARAVVSSTFRFFLKCQKWLGVTFTKVDNPEAYRNLHSKVIVANHPSYLDFVFIMSMVPNANCIVRGNLLRTPLGAVIRQAYIVNSLGFEELCRDCKVALDAGDNVIIFPEGTRTPRHGKNPYKKGAARIALATKCDVQPIFIGGSDKYGLGKNDPLFSYNPVEPYLYDFKMLDVIKFDDYAGLEETIAAKRMTQKMQEVLNEAGDRYEENHPLCVTLNNVHKDQTY